MIFNNQQQVLLKQRADEAARAAEAAITREELARKEEQNHQEAIDKKLHEAEQKLVKSIETMFINEKHRFKARLSEDYEYVELYSSGNILVGKYTRLPSGLFQIVDGSLKGLMRDEEITLSKMKPAIFNVMEECFK